MTEDTDMRFVVAPLDGDQETPYLVAVANSADLGTMLLTIASEGDPYWAFQSLSNDILTADSIGADWTDAPVVDTNAQTNRNNVAGLYASPPATGVGGKVWAA